MPKVPGSYPKLCPECLTKFPEFLRQEYRTRRGRNGQSLRARNQGEQGIPFRRFPGSQKSQEAHWKRPLRSPPSLLLVPILLGSREKRIWFVLKTEKTAETREGAEGTRIRRMVCILGLSQEELCGLCVLCGSIFFYRRQIRRFYNFLSNKKRRDR